MAVFEFKDKGYHEVKNIEDPVQAYSVQQVGGIPPQPELMRDSDPTAGSCVQGFTNGDAVLETAARALFL